MQTYSHFIITAAIKRVVRNRELTLDPPLSGKGFLWGSILPDLPLTLIAIVTMLRDIASRNADNGWTQWLFDTAFFEVTWVKVAHNLFHGPIPIFIYLGIGFFAWKKYGAQWAAFIFWLACGCLLHTLIDIPLHYNDGPLVWFPFNFEYRFFSPVSYWDPAHYGLVAAPVEHVIVLGLLVWLIVDWRRKRVV